MAELKAREREARKLPSQGAASTYDLLNVHTAPDRRSPSVFQIKENEKVDLLAHRVSPRIAGQPIKRKLVADTPAPAPPPRKPKVEKYPKPSLPKPPAPPEDWLEMSKSPPEVEAELRAAAEPEKPVPLDDWYLVRNAEGRSGWVVSNRLYLAIPDEVAQYAEGRRITSYFSLGEVQDGDQRKHHWVWTTIEQGQEPYQYDGFRVFIWSLRRHRYETAYRERNLKGYFPVLLEKVEMANQSGRKGAQATVQYPGFSVLVEKQDGKHYRRRYAFIGNIVRFAGETPETLQTSPGGLPVTRAASTGQSDDDDASMAQRLKDRVSAPSPEADGPLAGARRVRLV